MNLKTTFILILIIGPMAALNAQVIKNSAANINILTSDSQRLNCKNILAIISINYQTGETVIKARAENFMTGDSALKKFFFQKSNDIELHFVISKSTLDLLSTDNKEHSSESPAMLYINNHFHNVPVNFSMYNKNGNTVDLANNNIFFSFQCTFNPADFQLDGLNSFTSEPVLFWSSKQPINFTHTD